jgi:hypothetical protein
MISLTVWPGRPINWWTVSLWCAVFFAGTVYGGPAHDSAAPEITQDVAIRAIIIFRESDPYSEEASGAAGVVFNFTDKKHDVVVKISPRALPFAKSKNLSEKEFQILFGAFVVGNLNSQLLTGKREDDSYAGVLQLIETYQRMRRTHPRLHSDGIERLIELERKRQLKAYLSS